MHTHIVYIWAYPNICTCTNISTNVHTTKGLSVTHPLRARLLSSSSRGAVEAQQKSRRWEISRGVVMDLHDGIDDRIVDVTQEMVGMPNEVEYDLHTHHID